MVASMSPSMLRPIAAHCGEDEVNVMKWYFVAVPPSVPRQGPHPVPLKNALANSAICAFGSRFVDLAAMIAPSAPFRLAVRLAAVVPVFTIANPESNCAATFRNRGSTNVPMFAILVGTATRERSLPVASRTSRKVKMVTLPVVTIFAQSVFRATLFPTVITSAALLAREIFLKVPVNDGTLDMFVR